MIQVIQVIHVVHVIQVIQVIQVVQVIQVIQVNEETTFQRTKLVFVAIFSTNLGYIWSIKVILVFSQAYWLSSGPQ